MNYKHPLVTVILLLTTVVGLIGAYLFWLADPLYLKAPKDHELVDIFQRQHAEFEQLRRMILEDSEMYVSASHIGEHLSEARQQEYKNILSDISHGLVVTKGPVSIRFIFASGGVSAIGSGWLKGIEFVSGSADREGIIVKNLDQPASLAAGEVYLRQIEPGWFLVFQKND